MKKEFLIFIKYSNPVLLCTGLFLVIPPSFDIYWHLQIGKDIVEESIWPSPNTYSYISKNEWVIHSWFIDIIFYFLWYAGEAISNGLGILVLQINRYIFLIAFPYTIYILLQKERKNQTIAFLVMMMACMITWDRPVRPFLISPFFMIFFYLFVMNPQPHKYQWYALPLMMLFWVNSHGACFIACFYIGIKMFFDLIQWLASKKHCYPFTWHLLASILLLMSLINPHPISLIQRTLSAGSYPTLDWLSLLQRFLLNPIYFMPHLLIFMFNVILWMYMIKKSWKHIYQGKMSCILVDLTCFILGFLHFRLLWLIFLPIINLRHHLPPIFSKDNQTHWSLILSIFILLFLFQIPQKNAGVTLLPKYAVEYMKDHKISGNIITPWPWAGYVIWHTNKSAKIFVDTRIEPYDIKHIRLEKIFRYMPIKYLDEITKLNTEYILMPLESQNNEWIYLEEKGLIEILYKDENSFLAKINKNLVNEVYQL